MRILKWPERLDQGLLQICDQLILACWNGLGWRKLVALRAFCCVIVGHLVVHALAGANSTRLVYVAMAALIFIQGGLEYIAQIAGKGLNRWLLDSRGHLLTRAVRLVIGLLPLYDAVNWCEGRAPFHFIVHSLMFGLYFYLGYAVEPTGPRQPRDHKVKQRRQVEAV